MTNKVTAVTPPAKAQEQPLWRGINSALKNSPRLAQSPQLAAVSLAMKLQIQPSQGSVAVSQVGGKPCLFVLDRGAALGGLAVPKEYMGFPVCQEESWSERFRRSGDAGKSGGESENNNAKLGQYINIIV
jgi:hypothetical protein